MIREHRKTGSVLPAHVHSVDGQDFRFWIAVVCHQDVDPAGPEAQRVVDHPGVNNRINCLRSEVSGGVKGPVSPGSPVLVQMDLTTRTDGHGPDPDCYRVKGHFSTVLLHQSTEGRRQGEPGVSIDLSEVGVRTKTWKTQQRGKKVSKRPKYLSDVFFFWYLRASPEAPPCGDKADS